MQQASPLESVLRRDRTLVLAGLVGVAALAWAYITYLVWGMGDGMDMTAPMARSWGSADFALMFVMWAVMMMAMMVPTAAPMVLLFATVNRRRRHRQAPFVPAGVFLVGYVVVWAGFSALATVVQWQLHNAALLSSTMASASPILGGGLLVVAGLFQWSPLKNVCLSHCRTPVGFLMTEWRDGTGGALRMGLKHGTYCVGCCWALMGLLFVAGVMNLLWVALIAGFVLVEKVAPAGPWVSRAVGVGLVGLGVWMIVVAAAL